jgi:hypothetical protein
MLNHWTTHSPIASTSSSVWRVSDRRNLPHLLHLPVPRHRDSVLVYTLLPSLYVLSVSKKKQYIVLVTKLTTIAGEVLWK